MRNLLCLPTPDFSAIDIADKTIKATRGRNTTEKYASEKNDRRDSARIPLL